MIENLTLIVPFTKNFWFVPALSKPEGLENGNFSLNMLGEVKVKR